MDFVLKSDTSWDRWNEVDFAEGGLKKKTNKIYAKAGIVWMILRIETIKTRQS